MSEMQTLLPASKLLIVAVVVAFVAVLVHADVEIKEVNSFDRQAYVGAKIELECDLRNFYDSEIQWRKLVGVSIFFLLV